MTAPDPRVGEIEARLLDEVWTDMPALTEDEVIMHRVYDDEGHCIAECSDPVNAEFIANAPADVAYLLAELRKAHEALAAVEKLERRWATLAEGDRYYARRIRESIRAAVAAANGDGQ